MYYFANINIINTSNQTKTGGDFMLYIAENLKSLRKSKDWTQEDMAEIISISPQSISKWERGETYPDITLLPTLANLFNVSVDAIIGMDKINKIEAREKIFLQGHNFLRENNHAEAEKTFTDALKIFPSDEGIMLELALVLAMCGDTTKLNNAVNICERILNANPTEKIRHTTRAAICFIYFKLGEKEKATVAAQSLPHLRESRENILAELRDEPDIADINAYLRFITLGEKDNQDKILVDFGLDMVTMFNPEYKILDKIKKLRNENGIKKIPHVRMRDNDTLSSKKVRVIYCADILLEKEFTNPAEAVDEILCKLESIAQRQGTKG